MRIGIVGAGSMGAVHAAAWRRVVAAEPEAVLAGIVARRRENAEALARKHEVPVLDDLDALLSEIDVVDLCVPTDLHAALTERAATAGVHVLVEKPLALTLAEADAMIDACEAAGVRLFVAMVVRFFPQYAAAAELLTEGALGAPGVIRLKRVAWPPGSAGDWFHNPARSGGMPLDLMIHDLDVARWWGGEVERVYARALRGGPGGRTADAAAGGATGGASDYALATLRHTGGAISLVEGGWAYPAGTFRTAFDVAGDAGLIEWDSDRSEPVARHLQPADGSADRVGLPLTVFERDPYELELHHAYRAIRDDAPFSVTAADARAALALALAVKRSVAESRPVALAELG